MSDIGEEKIRRWRQRIEECRIEAESLGPEGQLTMQTVPPRLAASFLGISHHESGIRRMPALALAPNLGIAISPLF